MQHTATHCNTLQHPATPSNILQHRKSGFRTQRFKECRLHPTILMLYNCNTPSHLHRRVMVHVQMGSRRCCVCMCSRFFLFISHRGRVALCHSVLQCVLQSRRDSRCARPEFISSFTMTHLWKCECVLQWVLQGVLQGVLHVIVAVRALSLFVRVPWHIYAYSKRDTYRHTHTQQRHEPA